MDCAHGPPAVRSTFAKPSAWPEPLMVGVMLLEIVVRLSPVIMPEANLNRTRNVPEANA